MYAPTSWTDSQAIVGAAAEAVQYNYKTTRTVWYAIAHAA